MSTLESEFEESLRNEGSTDLEQEVNKNYLLLLHYHRPTLEHSIRAYFKGVEIANFLGIHKKEDRKRFFTSVSLHDIGKHFVDRDILEKTTDYTKEDHEKMKIHPEYGYRLLRWYDPIVAETVLRHHRFGKDPYPSSLPKSSERFSKEEIEKIEEYARYVCLIDIHDAATTRRSQRIGRPLSEEETKKFLIQRITNQKELIEGLYKKGIFGSKK